MVRTHDLHITSETCNSLPLDTIDTIVIDTIDTIVIDTIDTIVIDTIDTIVVVSSSIKIRVINEVNTLSFTEL